MPFCSKCGTEVPENVNFCQKCGSALHTVANTNFKSDIDGTQKFFVGLVMSIAGLIATILMFVGISHDHSYSYSAPFTDHEITNIVKLVGSIILLAIGIGLAYFTRYGVNFIDKAKKNFDSPNSTDNKKDKNVLQNLFGYYVKCLKNYANFKGKARRKEFWGFYLFYFIFGLALNSTLDGVYFPDIYTSILVNCIYYFMEGGRNFHYYHYLLFYSWSYVSSLCSIYSLVFFLPLLAVTFRRFHDIGKSGWNFLWSFTIIGIIPVINWLCRKGESCSPASK